MQNNEAGRIISVIDKRIEKHTRSMAQVETTWGEVAGISADGKYASAYLYGSEYVSDGFRIPQTLALSVGDKVKVAWDARGDRWVYETGIPSSYKKIAINPNAGTIHVGDGTSAPSILIADSSGVIVGVHDHDADYEPLGAVASHEGESDPHPVYNIAVNEVSTEKVATLRLLRFGTGFDVDETLTDQAWVDLDLSEINHNTLTGKDAAGAHPAAALTVADAGSILDATTVEDALQELRVFRGRHLRRTSSHSISNSTYTVGQSYTNTLHGNDDTIVTYDGVNELVVDRAGLYFVWVMAQFAQNTTGIRIAGIGINDTTTTGPNTEHQARMPVSSDANQDHVWAMFPVTLAANDRICLKLWQNSGAALNAVTYELGVFYMGADQ